MPGDKTKTKGKDTGKEIKKEEEEDDFIAKSVSYMAQALYNKLPEDGIKQFGQLATDTERFAYVWRMSDAQDVVQLEPEYEKKSAEKARTHREKGNEYFQKQSYVTALGEYNISVKYAPLNDDASGSGENQEQKVDTSSNNEENQNKEANSDQVEQKDNTSKPDEGSVHANGTGDSKVPDKQVVKNELALAYANRSAALFHLKKYKDCLRDIELAFESKYPEEMHHKLYERQGASLREMGRINEAVASFQKAVDSLSLAQLTPKAENTRKQALTKLLESCKKLEEKPQIATTASEECNKLRAPALTGEKNSVYPQASYAVKIQYNNTVGRHAVAARDVKVGDILISESPYSAIMLPGNYASLHCYNCFASTRAPVPCVQCSSVIFCSRECRNTAWQTYHWAECLYGELLCPSICAKIGHLALRLVMTKGLEPLLAYLKAHPTETAISDKTGLNSDGIYSGDYDCVYNLVANSKPRKAEELFDFTVAACLLTKTMLISGYLRPIADSPGDIELIGGAVLRHLQIVQCNAKRIVELSWPEKFDDPKPVFVGVGIYPTAALVNHSCDPNADLNFYGDSVVVRAIRNIAEGEEIAISYGPVFYEVKQRLRTAQLKGAFYFSCRCEACLENWPVAEEMFNDLPRYRCEKCRSPLVVEDKFEKKFFTCAFCKHKQDMEDLVGRLQLSFDVFARAMNTAMNGRSEAALPDLVQHLLLLQTYIRHPWRDLAQCQAAIKQCYRLLANVKQR